MKAVLQGNQLITLFRQGKAVAPSARSLFHTVVELQVARHQDNQVLSALATMRRQADIMQRHLTQALRLALMLWRAINLAPLGLMHLRATTALRKVIGRSPAIRHTRLAITRQQ